ncbi:hypothetical protein [Sorangium sp. So ce1024]|uniref:hypothetical protein n=1 Tax=unclassified Sorangium TaxID=2621164 RepID=UPI003F10A82D
MKQSGSFSPRAQQTTLPGSAHSQRSLMQTVPGTLWPSDRQSFVVAQSPPTYGSPPQAKGSGKTVRKKSPTAQSLTELIVRPVLRHKAGSIGIPAAPIRRSAVGLILERAHYAALGLGPSRKFSQVGGPQALVYGRRRSRGLDVDVVVRRRLRP